MNIQNYVKGYNIIAGINGAGKTSLYSIMKNTAGLGKRINIDEIVESWGGDWRDTLNQIKAGRAAMEMINNCIEKGITFHQETTLPGATIMRQVKKAIAAGYKINLYFVGVDNIHTAIERVHKRVALGGHGINDSVIIKRFNKMPENLSRLLPLCDLAVFYDNTIKFRQIAIISKSKCIDCDADVPVWFKRILHDRIV